MMSFSRSRNPVQTQKKPMVSDFKNSRGVLSGKVVSRVTMEQVREKHLMECEKRWKRYVAIYRNC